MGMSRGEFKYCSCACQPCNCCKPATSQRDHLINLNYVTGQIQRDGNAVKITMDISAEKLKVGCTEIAFLALEKLYQLYKSKKVSPTTIVLQEGSW